MFYWALVFLVVALAAGLLGFTGIAGVAANIAWLLFVVGLILFVVFLVLGRRRPPCRWSNRACRALSSRFREAEARSRSAGAETLRFGS